MKRLLIIALVAFGLVACASQEQPCPKKYNASKAMTTKKYKKSYSYKKKAIKQNKNVAKKAHSNKKKVTNLKKKINNDKKSV